MSITIPLALLFMVRKMLGGKVKALNRVLIFLALALMISCRTFLRIMFVRLVTFIFWWLMLVIICRSLFALLYIVAILVKLMVIIVKFIVLRRQSLVDRLRKPKTENQKPKNFLNPRKLPK